LQHNCCMIRSLLLLSCILTAGCLIHSDPLPAVWFYTYSRGPVDDRDTLMTPASFLEFRADGSYTRDFGHFEYGSWVRNGNTLSLTNQHHKTHSFVLAKIDAEDMELAINDGVSEVFERHRLPDNESAEDPFCITNNRWRLPAQHKESIAEIRQRLYNHCQCWEAYFTWALHNDLSTLDVRSMPTPLKMYGNGFSLKSMADLPVAWKLYFYDEQDCQKANDILKDIIQNKNIAWANTDSRYKMFIGVFQQMEKFLR
jgi:hypothetical protein